MTGFSRNLLGSCAEERRLALEDRVVDLALRERRSDAFMIQYKDFIGAFCHDTNQFTKVHTNRTDGIQIVYHFTRKKETHRRKTWAILCVDYFSEQFHETTILLSNCITMNARELLLLEKECAENDCHVCPPNWDTFEPITAMMIGQCVHFGEFMYNEADHQILNKSLTCDFCYPLLYCFVDESSLMESIDRLLYCSPISYTDMYTMDKEGRKRDFVRPQNNQTTITMRRRPCCCMACLTNEQQQYNPDITNYTDPKLCQHEKVNGTPFQVTHHWTGDQKCVRLHWKRRYVNNNRRCVEDAKAMQCACASCSLMQFRCNFYAHHMRCRSYILVIFDNVPIYMKSCSVDVIMRR